MAEISNPQSRRTPEMSVFEFRIDILRKGFKILDMKHHTVRGEVQVLSENKTISVVHNFSVAHGG